MAQMYRIRLAKNAFIQQRIKRKEKDFPLKIACQNLLHVFYLFSLFYCQLLYEEISS